ncbi:MAG: phosphatase 2C-like domain-containing protein [Monoraphidium minutum]|nr:MAG: phosphatase 2C-like domain-containing protein [Monoraphidium minutum]
MGAALAEAPPAAGAWAIERAWAAGAGGAAPAAAPAPAPAAPEPAGSSGAGAGAGGDERLRAPPPAGLGPHGAAPRSWLRAPSAARRAAAPRPAPAAPPCAAGGVFGAAPAAVFMGAAASQGPKSFMEDAHFLATLDPLNAAGPHHNQNHNHNRARGGGAAGGGVASIGVFDGHQGCMTANQAAAHMPELLAGALAGRLQSSLSQPGAAVGSAAGMSSEAVASSFLAFDRWWCDARCDPALTQHGWDESGATALVGLLAGNTLTVGNAGDGAALLVRGGRAQRLSEEHRASGNAAEAERVLTAGGRLVSLSPGTPPRLVGASGAARYRASMVTRALGDYAFKQPDLLISPEPALTSVALTPADSLLLVATDGVTDVLPDDDALAIALVALERARERTDDGGELARAAARAVADCARLRGSTDNVTAAVMLFDWQGGLAG